MRKRLLQITFSICLIVGLTGFALQPPDSGIYTQMYESGNTSGYHTFNTAALLADLGDYEIITHFPHVDGEVVSIRQGRGSTPILLAVVLHHNGRVGPRNLNLDTLKVNIDQMAQMSRALQTTFAKYEYLPGGIGRTTIFGR